MAWCLSVFEAAAAEAARTLSPDQLEAESAIPASVAALYRELPRLTLNAAGPPQFDGPTGIPDRVTLDQAAVIVHRKKRSLENYKKDKPPKPDPAWIEYATKTEALRACNREPTESGALASLARRGIIEFEQIPAAKGGKRPRLKMRILKPLELKPRGSRKKGPKL